MRMRFLLPALLVAAAAVNSGLHAQSDGPRFEVASIKSNTSESLRSSWGWDQAVFTGA